ncbi:NADH-quinone oxidoreductase subunit J family protein [Candidatus Viridilinea mediisalina]|uniref:NADH-quinone oxidoreductase subunit J n=1 Tax=Candidatus Viridilinea mediisalina TaxID=2024553 RepID=A0A2A6RM51_9CHLR|nr:NADH-quinone oxidoreductase subunit J [Candidatus Viridilinea mediisalina]PDW03971.1 NADH-quinone oxidoreductase subunit J [Candidatus Viridilinea mediisalina]
MNILIQVIFGLLSALIVGAAMMAVTVRNIIHAALWLIACFFGVGALYLLLEAEFIAVVQVLIYVGAVSILILFAIMLTRQIEGARHLVTGWRLWVTIAICVALFATVLVPTLLSHNWNVPPPVIAEGSDLPAEPLAGAAELGRDFVFVYLLHFQVTGVLLTMALIGAIVIAFEERARRRRVLTLAEEHALREQKKNRGTEEQENR